MKKLTWPDSFINSVICANCLDVLPLIPDGAVDAVITDPPYGIADSPLQGQERTGKRVGGVNNYHPKSDWDEFVNPKWCEQSCRVSKYVLWFGFWRQRYLIESYMPYPIITEIVWNKDCHTSPPCPVARKDERLWIFGKEFKAARFDTSVWDEPIIPTWERREHKNEKPLSLMRRAIALTDADIILDPFCGSGTTLVAAKQLGRRYIGIEISPKYCKIAEQRLAQEQLQFDPSPPKPELPAKPLLDFNE